MLTSGFAYRNVSSLHRFIRETFREGNIIFVFEDFIITNQRSTDRRGIQKYRQTDTWLVLVFFFYVIHWQ